MNRPPQVNIAFMLDVNTMQREFGLCVWGGEGLIVGMGCYNVAFADFHESGKANLLAEYLIGQLAS